MVLIFIILLVNTNLFAEKLSLKESLEIALENNPGIHRAKEKIAEARAKKRETFTSFLPKLGSASTFTELSEETEFYGMTITGKELYDLN
ncbi:MAG: TolC family protein, partial [Candidatus Omnitrophica bacterium]|nr:TolC family protein [Candidatus Omnitrophota bacterium]